MKKLLLVLTLILGCVLNLNAQVEQVPDSTITVTEAERIIDKYSEKISDSFNEGITKIAPSVKEGFEVVVKLQIGIGLFNIAVSILCITLILLMIKNWKTICYNDCELAATFLAIISIITFPITLYQGIVHLAAPEWYAMKEIIELF